MRQTVPATLIEMLAERVARAPESEAFSFGGRGHTWREIWRRIGACGARLVEHGVGPADRVVMALPNGADFFAWFYGVQRAGGIAVPTFPGSGPRRLERLARRCGARLVVVGKGVGETASVGAPPPESGLQKGRTGGDATEHWDPEAPLLYLRADDMTVDREPSLPSKREPTSDDIAYIQYTSGSTGEPKGVQLSHGNVLANIRQLIAGFEITPDDVFVSWLPAYHDMGLVLMTMVPFSLGARLVLLPASLRSLGPWLQAIEEHRGTFTAAPDFGYRAALRLALRRGGRGKGSEAAGKAASKPRVGGEARPRGPGGNESAGDPGSRSSPEAAIDRRVEVQTGERESDGDRDAADSSREHQRPDLASLRVALNAAEPVRATTIEAFERAFGLEQVMIAGYGLAEATVGVSAWPPGQPPLVDERGCVSVGRPFPDVEVAILGEDGLSGPNQPGEILVRSPANTRGYWATPASRILSRREIQYVESESTDREGEEADLFWEDGFIRTGDLGHLDDDGNLFVAGRLKHIVIQAGRNIAPREVEEIVDALPFVRRSAAIGIDRGDAAGEQLYLLAEMREHSCPEEGVCRERVVSIVEVIKRDLGLRPGRTYLTAPRTIPYTANGKVRYGELKEAYGSGQLRRGGRLWYPSW